ncbi:MAG: hypothetical protein KGN80_10530, partial [Acidobacteriota bacterium]|nr:hypothetical protein [Acidobacteriota bacterium]
PARRGPAGPRRDKPSSPAGERPAAPRAAKAGASPLREGKAKPRWTAEKREAAKRGKGPGQFGPSKKKPHR